MIQSISLWLAAILAAPFFSGLILKIKAFFGGKKGPPILINYYTLIKLFKKGSVYSSSTTFVFKLGPVISLAASITVLMFLPIAGFNPVFSFNGDVIFVLYVLGLGRFFTIAAAMDTASPFEGMGAAREAYFPIICEAAMFMILIFFYRITGELQLSAYFAGSSTQNLWSLAGAPLVFIVLSFFIILLTENSRVPVDDPATHLELTMIHEVMVLDHSGPDFGLIELGSFCKLMFYSTIISRMIVPFESAIFGFHVVMYIAGLLIVYIAVGVTESITARYRMDKVPKFVLTSFALAFFATIITLEFVK
ncbi:MAG: NADH-quinone oxidoreductase subunit H [Desulfobacter postgatei]|uniref:respiratory chain complex I subunit 1 family protein n=1 Tax=Desulfobacter postgatei TaxID=2293 RepID=UPI0023F0875E|nr:NADH-quinone oxidoreductase subunit H [Desulfobacter postgatei]MDD4273464.1 NADH-quinone oxidoreductase subunit H [Desulfobacter postgatei]